MANSEDPDLHIAAFYQGLQCLLRQNQSSEKEIQYYLETITCDPSIYIVDHSDCIESNFIENFIGLKRVKSAHVIVVVVITLSLARLLHMCIHYLYMF